MIKVLLTGATGFIGSHLARLLLRQGCAVSAVVRPTSDLWRLKDLQASLQLVPCDLLSKEEVENRLSSIRPDICFHMAWHSNPGQNPDHADNLNHVIASLYLVRTLVNAGCQRFLIAGTSIEYNTTDGLLCEESPARPRNLYAASKYALQVVADQYLQTVSANLVWLRFFSIYGPFEDEYRLVPSVILALLRGEVAKVTPGEQLKDYLHVEDAAAAVWAVATSPFRGMINIGSGCPVSVGELAMKIGTIMNRRELVSLGALPYRSSEPKSLCADISRLKTVTGWSPHFDLESGLRHTIDWWKAHPKEKIGVRA